MSLGWQFVLCCLQESDTPWRSPRRIFSPEYRALNVKLANNIKLGLWIGWGKLYGYKIGEQVFFV